MKRSRRSLLRSLRLAHVKRRGGIRALPAVPGLEPTDPTDPATLAAEVARLAELGRRDGQVPPGERGGPR